jgi:hypothetical protein
VQRPFGFIAGGYGTMRAKRMRPLLILFALLVIGTDTAHAQSDPAGFQSPSKNISCAFFVDGARNFIRCDIAVMDVKPKRPADCQLEYGQAFLMYSKGAAERICYGDALTDKPLVAYGEAWQHGGFTCTAEQTGVTCLNADRHGFSLSRAKQELF